MVNKERYKQNIMSAAWWCICQLEKMEVDIIVGQGIFYEPATEYSRARLGYDIDPNYPSYEYGQLVHEFAHHLEGYSHRHERNWGLDKMLDADGDFNGAALYREDVVDAVAWLIRELHNAN